jgi:hypothetical protein
MAIRLNHTILATHDKETSATFLTHMLGLPAPLLLGPFAVAQGKATAPGHRTIKEPFPF